MGATIFHGLAQSLGIILPIIGNGSIFGHIYKVTGRFTLCRKEAGASAEAGEQQFHIHGFIVDNLLFFNRFSRKGLLATKSQKS